MYPFSKDDKEMPVLGWLGQRFITSPSGDSAELEFSLGSAAVLGLKGVFALVLDELWEVRDAVCGCRQATQRVHDPAALPEVALDLPEPKPLG